MSPTAKSFWTPTTMIIVRRMICFEEEDVVHRSWMPTDQLTKHQHLFRHLFSQTSVCALCQLVNSQIFRVLHWTWWPRLRLAGLCWSPDGSNRGILLVPDNQNSFLVITYRTKRDFDVRKCIRRASGPEERRLLKIFFNSCGRSCRRISECRKEFVNCLCAVPKTRSSCLDVLRFCDVVTVFYQNIFLSLKCTKRDWRIYSDTEVLWFSRSKHALTLLGSDIAIVCVDLGGLLLVLQFEAFTLDPTNFSLFSFRPPAMDLTTAYRYNQNMMEYYTCKSKS